MLFPRNLPQRQSSRRSHDQRGRHSRQSSSTLRGSELIPTIPEVDESGHSPTRTPSTGTAVGDTTPRETPAPLRNVDGDESRATDDKGKGKLNEATKKDANQNVTNTADGSGENRIDKTKPKDVRSSRANGDQSGPEDRWNENDDNTLFQRNGERKRILTEHEFYDILGYSFSTFQKWMILVVLALAQFSVNFNGSMLTSAIDTFTNEFDISEPRVRAGQMIFFLTYALGCKLWAPWSEEFGRAPTIQFSLFLTILSHIPALIARNYSLIIISRALGGLSAGGVNITFGSVADIWETNDQQFAVAFITLASVTGSAVAPLVGAFINDWRWIFWVQLYLGIAIFILCIACVPETRATILLNRHAQRIRLDGDDHVYGPNVAVKNRLGFKNLFNTSMRSFYLSVTEPIIISLALLSGFSNAILFTFLESFPIVYSQWGFDPIQTRLAFLPLLGGFIFSYLSFFHFFWHHRMIRSRNPDVLQPESRFYWLRFTAPLAPLGLLSFSFVSSHPATVHWSGPMVCTILVGVANYSVYMATTDYLIASYGPFSASATGGSGFARNFLAGVAMMYSVPFYRNIGETEHLEYPGVILACLAVAVTSPVFLLYPFGPTLRKKSRFATAVMADLDAKRRRRDAQDRDRTVVV